jgi:hypothetical protein
VLYPDTGSRCGPTDRCLRWKGNIPSLCVVHSLSGSVSSTPVFKFIVIGVKKSQCLCITQNADRLVERYIVFQQIAGSVVC